SSSASSAKRSTSVRRSTLSFTLVTAWATSWRRSSRGRQHRRSRRCPASGDRGEGEGPRGGIRSVPEPEALLAGLQRPRARARGRSEPSAARALEVLLALLLAPRRVLRGARQRPHGPGGVGPLRPLPLWPNPAAGARRDPRAGARVDRRAVPPLD